MFNGIWRDLVHAGRSLARARAFTFVCVVSLGVGMAPVIGVPYAFRMFWTPPPGVDTNGLVEFVTTRVGPRRATARWSYPDFVDLRDANSGMVVTGWTLGDSKVTIQSSGTAGQTTTVPTMFVSPNYFTTIGVALARGSGFSAATDPAVVLGSSFWWNRLGSDPDIIGKTLTLDGIPHVVVGIAPHHFSGHLALYDAELFVPLDRHPLVRGGKDARFDRAHEWIRIHARLSPGVGLLQASETVAGITAQLARQYPATNESRAGVVAAYHAGGSLDGARMPLITAVWMGMTGMVLLVVCLNISGMIQVRSAMRERDLSIRQAVGASRGRLVQHLLAEAVLLASAGASLASLALFNGPALMAWMMGEPLTIQLREALRVDLPMIAILLGICFVATLAFGLLPALRFSHPAFLSVLKDDAGVGGFRTGRVHRVTAALQVAIAVPMLVFSGMSLDRVRTTAMAELGFASDLIYAVPLVLEDPSDESARSAIRRAQDDLEKASGVASATLADGLPLDFDSRRVRTSAQANSEAAPRFATVHATRVGDDYLRTMGIPLLRGRDFGADDGVGAELVTVVSLALANNLFPDAEAVGRQLTLRAGEKTQQTVTVVGVTSDFPASSMSENRAQLLLPLAQHPASDLYFVARASVGGQPMEMIAALENTVRDVAQEAGLVVPAGDDAIRSRIVTGESLRQKSTRDFLLRSAETGTLGGVLLILAALGIYGVVGLMIATRTREIAVRITLGASRPRVLRMILFDVVKLVTPGVAVGLVIAFALVRTGGDNIGVPPSSLAPLAFVAGAAIAMLTAVIASLFPAYRASSVQPMVAIRSE